VREVINKYIFIHIIIIIMSIRIALLERRRGEHLLRYYTQFDLNFKIFNKNKNK
jgi:uncharacterized membrane protein